MLVVKIFVNLKQIDEIQIHNETGGEDSVYHIEDHPELGTFKHKRSSGYKPLLRDVLRGFLAQERLDNAHG